MNFIFVGLTFFYILNRHRLGRAPSHDINYIKITRTHQNNMNIIPPPDLCKNVHALEVIVLHYGLNTPNASPIETDVNCPNSAGRIHHFSTYQ